MDKLTIEHLAPYLPYGISCQINFPNKPEIGIMKAVGLHPGIGGEDLLSVHIEIEKDNSRQIILKKNAKKSIVKPLLIPLSELTNPIFDGVAPLSIISYEYFGFGKGYISEPEFNAINSNGFIGFQKRNECLFFVREETNYGISTYFTHQLKNEGLWIAQKVTCQLEMFMQLFKWHFDVFGLIDAGLALNKLDYIK
jgi:hypothetical protein